ncbi:RHS repeat-associated core domain-containing protein [Pseudomonas soli]|uniref:RHS repeat-associated core domain-containing protein n=1 Tax=Pseudomonas soli TaxID=1306993 RepID=A0AAJ5MK05_9PSED|nr:RHS repeat-associated core domain-containing protein [Pseudomonas soli]UXZ45873.1 RHS repeat-associated core domain-containing protein [Pseudomonas soli]
MSEQHSKTWLMVIDLSGSISNVVPVDQGHVVTYLPYGFRQSRESQSVVLSFNGQCREPATGHYLLGSGYRAYNPVLMRFNSPDSWSPFGLGGLNGYVYCESDPVNQQDPSGHMSFGLAWLFNSAGKVGRRQSTVKGSGIPRIRVDPVQSTVASPVGSPLVSPDFIGFHGSTDANGNSLLGGLAVKHQNSASGLSSGKGFYVAPTKRTAVDFAEAATSYALDDDPSSSVKPEVFSVFVYNLDAKVPGKDYRFGTMGEGGLVPRQLNEMELLLREKIYGSVRIRRGEPTKRQTLPRATEAPF